MKKDKDGKAIMNYYFAAKIKIDDNWKKLFVRPREKSGHKNKFYVHEIYTEDEIKKSETKTALRVQTSFSAMLPTFIEI